MLSISYQLYIRTTKQFRIPREIRDGQVSFDQSAIVYPVYPILKIPSGISSSPFCAMSTNIACDELESLHSHLVEAKIVRCRFKYRKTEQSPHEKEECDRFSFITAFSFPTSMAINLIIYLKYHKKEEKESKC